MVSPSIRGATLIYVPWLSTGTCWDQTCILETLPCALANRWPPQEAHGRMGGKNLGSKLGDQLEHG